MWRDDESASICRLATAALTSVHDGSPDVSVSVKSSVLRPQNESVKRFQSEIGSFFRGPHEAVAASHLNVCVKVGAQQHGHIWNR